MVHLFFSSVLGNLPLLELQLLGKWRHKTSFDCIPANEDDECSADKRSHKITVITDNWSK